MPRNGTSCAALLLLLLTANVGAVAQTPVPTPTQTSAPTPRQGKSARAPRVETADPAAAQRRAQAVALLNTLASEATGFRDGTLRAANSAPGFTGEDGKLVAEFRTKGSGWITDLNAQEFDLADVLAALAADDWDRAVQLAESFNGEAARVTAVVTLARTVLTTRRR